MLATRLKTTPLSMVRGICHKSRLPEKKVFKWPYEKWPYNNLTRWYDPLTMNKFDENTKLIQVEGNIDCGKVDFAKKLADQLDMKVITIPDPDSYYVNEHGYDYTALNPLLPERLRLCTMEMLHENPARHSGIHLHYYYFKFCVYQLVKALQHMFNTGQGVILVRSAFTHRAMIEAMHEVGWLPMGHIRADGFKFYDWRHFYINLRNTVLQKSNIMRPHLTIYLETPVDVCMKRIKASTNPHVANSNLLVPEYLEGIEKAYEEVVLPRQEYHSHVLRVPYPEKMSADEVLDVVDEIEQLDFNYDSHHTRFDSWVKQKTTWHSDTRKLLTSSKVAEFTEYFMVNEFDIAGIGDSITQVDLNSRSALFDGHVGAVGRSKSIHQDSRLVSWTQLVEPRIDFGTKLQSYFKNDFV